MLLLCKEHSWPKRILCFALLQNNMVDRKGYPFSSFYKTMRLSDNRTLFSYFYGDLICINSLDNPFFSLLSWNLDRRKRVFKTNQFTYYTNLKKGYPFMRNKVGLLDIFKNNLWHRKGYVILCYREEICESKDIIAANLTFNFQNFLNFRIAGTVHWFW
jgi:hypothetical protein